MQFKKKISIATLTLLSTLTLTACGQNDSEAVATGDDISISQEDFIQQLKDTSGSSVLQQMVLSDVFEKEVGEDKAKELKDQASQQLAMLKQQYDDEEQFKTVLASSGFDSAETYEKQLYYYSLMSEAVGKNIDVSDEELKKAYDEYEPPIEVSHILVDDEDKAKELITELDNGADFAELAKENSTDSTAENGGSLGEVSKGQMVAEFEDAAFALDEGAYSKEPVKTEYGYHIIKVTKKNKKGSLDEEKSQLQDSIRQDKMQDSDTVNKVVKDLIAKYNVKINDKDLQDALSDYTDAEASSESSSEEKGSSESTSETSNDESKSDSASKDNSSESESTASSETSE